MCLCLLSSGAESDAAITQSVQKIPDCQPVPGMQGGTGWRNSWWVNVGAVISPLLLLLMTEVVRASRMVVMVVVVMQTNCLPTCVHKSRAWHGQTDISRIKPLPNCHGGWCKEHTHPMHLFLVVFLQWLPNSHPVLGKLHGLRWRMLTNKPETTQNTTGPRPKVPSYTENVQLSCLHGKSATNPVQ